MPRRRTAQLPEPIRVRDYAYVWHPGQRKRLFLGRWDSQEAETKWRRIAAEYVRNPLAGVMSPDGVTVAEIMAGYLEFLKSSGASANVRDQDGRACVSLTVAYGDLPISEFGPRQLRTWAATLADPKLADEFDWHRPRLDNRADVSLGRKTIKAFCTAALRAIRWAIGEDMVRAAETRIEDLALTDPLAALKVRKPKKRLPADPADVRRTIEQLTPTLATSVMILQLTGMRCSEMLSMRPMDIRRGGELELASGQRIRIGEETDAARRNGWIAADESVWFYVPESHKTAHHGIDRVIPIMPAVQRLLAALPAREADLPYISPKDSTAQHRERQAIRRAETGRKIQSRDRKAKPKKAPTDRYQNSQYRQAIHRACDRAGVNRWTPHQLRHAALTAVVDATGDIRGAQSLGGHDSPRTTETYVAKSMAGAVEAAAALAGMG